MSESAKRRCQSKEWLDAQHKRGTQLDEKTVREMYEAGHTHIINGRDKVSLWGGMTMSETRDKEAEILNENITLKAQNAELADLESKAKLRCEELEHDLSDLKGKVRFLEGQIEAYQYCMNCRR